MEKPFRKMVEKFSTEPDETEEELINVSPMLARLTHCGIVVMIIIFVIIGIVLLIILFLYFWFLIF